jgi:hypothetical protein
VSSPRLSLEKLHQARASLRRLADGRRANTDEDAARFIDERGFAMLMPINGIPLPSLAEADGAAPWAEEFRCTDRAWAWKETLPAGKLCAYGKFIRGRGAFIGWRLYPAFVAVYGPAEDLAGEYEAGRLARVDRDLAEIVAAGGPIDSRELWRRARPLFGGKRHHFLAALERLQTSFYVTVAGGSLEGWTRHTWDLVERWVPDGLLDKLPAPREARRAILRQTLENCAAAPESQLRAMLRWPAGEFEKCLRGLLDEGSAVFVEVENEGKPWVAWRNSS